MVSIGYGLREVIVDQHFSGKWSDVDLNPGGGHGTFHGTKSSHSAGGFSYKSTSSPKQIMQNRFIYWRILGDTLELTESSLDYNLENNQIRYIFRDTPIVSPISIHEDENQIVILVATVTSVNRFNFIHPTKLFPEDTIFRNKIPSIFNQVTSRPLMNFKGFNLSEHTINVPVPTTVSSHVLPHNSGYIFALAYESGAISIAKISKEDTLNLYDLRQSNLFTRLLSFTTSLRAPAPSTDATVGLSFFIGKLERVKCMFLVSLSMNGHLRLYVNNIKAASNEWTVLTDILIDKRFAIDGYTDCNVILRRSNNEGANETPKFVVFLPTVGFKVYQVLRSDVAPPILTEIQSIVFREKSVMDFTSTSEFLYVLVSNSEEETEWELKSFNFGDTENPRFNLALLEPLPRQDRTDIPATCSAKEFYLDLIFNKCSFSSHTIYSALSIFESYVCFPKFDNDWELTKKFAMMVMDKELSSITKEIVEPIPEEKWLEICMSLWLSFYNSCVEYHNATMKPLGLFYDMNTRMVCLVKKSRISFLRQTDLLETLYYFPHCVVVPESTDPDDTSFQLGLLLKYLEIIDCIESTSDASYAAKICKRLRDDRKAIRRVFEEVANLLTEADPNSLLLERRHFIPILSSKLKDLGANGDPAMRLALSFLSSWDKETEVLDVMQEEMMMDERPPITEYFLASRLGANLTAAILKQLIQHRYMISKNTMILQSLIAVLFNQNNQVEGIQMVPSFQDQNEAQKIVTHYFALYQFCERSAEAINEQTLDTGLRIANTVNSSTVDHLVQGKLSEFWPMKVTELYCHSTLGGYAIRSRVRQPRNSLVVSYADAAGGSLWPAEDSLSRPFEEFLISACQYSALKKYALEMGTYIATDKPSLKQLYQGLAELMCGTSERALRLLRSISIQQLSCDPYFSDRILKLERVEPPFTLPYFEFYELAVQLFQIFEDSRSIMIIAEDAVRNCIEDKRVRRMCSLGFKQAMILQDYKTAYRFIARAPNTTTEEGGGDVVLAQEKSSLIRTFVTQLLEKCDLDVLINLDMGDGYFKQITMTDEVERVLGTQARLSDPLSIDGIYQMVYLYHLSRRNFSQAAAAMLERVIQLGNKGKGRAALEAQKQSYLDILTCLSFTDDPKTAFVSRNLPDLMENLNANKEPLEFVEAFDGSKIPVFPPEPEYDPAKDVRTYDQILRECELCTALLVSKSPSVSPLAILGCEKRATAAVEFLTSQYRYDHAIKLALMWDLPITSVIQALANTCVNLLYDIPPPSGDPADYLRQLDINDIPSSNAPVVEIAFSILQNYLSKHEKTGDTSLHTAVAMELLTHDINFPSWFEDSFKKRDVSRLLICYIRFGDWGKATDLALHVMDASLGRRNADDFDITVQKVTALSDDPILPYTAINVLANQMYARMDKEPLLQELFDELRVRCSDYCVRVKETRQERGFMLSSTA